MHPRPPASQPPARDRSSTERSLLVLPVLSVLLFGTVHLELQAALGLAAAVAAALSLWGTRADRAPGRAATLWITCSTLVWMSGALVFLPVGPETRTKLQPLVAEAVRAGLDLVGQPTHALALAPAEAAVGWAWGGALLLLASAIALLHRPRERSLRMAQTLMLTGAALPLLAGLHRLLGAEQIFGWSGVPRGEALRQAFYAPFVNPNHAGAYMAAVAPLAALIAQRSARHHRIAGLGALGLLTVGVLSTASRSAAVALALGLGLSAAIAAPRRWAIAVIGLSAVILGATLRTGPLAAAAWLDRLLGSTQALREPLGQRSALWADAWTLATAQPWGPVGAGGFQPAWAVVRALPTYGNARHAHADLLQSLVENSAPVTLLIVVLLTVPAAWALVAALRSPRGRQRSQLAAWLGCWVALVAVSAVDFPAHIGALLMLAAIAQGELIAALTRADRPGLRPLRWVAAPVLAAALLGLWSACGHRLVPGAALTRGAPLAAEARALVASQPAEAAKLARSSLALEPLGLTALLTLADAEVAAGRADAAAATLRAATLAHPHSPWPHFAEAALAARRGDAKTRRRATQRALANNLPDNDDASAWIDRALSAETEPGLLVGQIIPPRADRLRDAALWLADHDDPLMASVVFEQAQALDPQINVPYARMTLLQGDPALALRQLARAPLRGCEALMVEGEALLQLRRAAEATVALRAALAQCPRPSLALRGALGLARCATGDVEGAALVEQVLKDAPDRHGLRHQLAACLVSQGRGRQALPHLQALSDAGQLHPDEKALLARLQAGLPR